MRETVVCILIALAALASAIRVPVSWDDDLKIKSEQKSGLIDGFKKYKVSNEKKNYNPKYKRLMHQKQELENEDEENQHFKLLEETENHNSKVPQSYGLYEETLHLESSQGRPNKDRRNHKLKYYHKNDGYDEKVKQNSSSNKHTDIKNRKYKPSENDHRDYEEEDRLHEDISNHKLESHDEKHNKENDRRINKPKKIYNIHKTEENWKNLGFDFDQKPQFNFNPFEQTTEPHQEVFAKIEQLGENLNPQKKKEEFPGFRFQKQTVWSPDNVEHNLRLTNSEKSNSNRKGKFTEEENGKNKAYYSNEEDTEEDLSDKRRSSKDSDGLLNVEDIENEETEEHEVFKNKETEEHQESKNKDVNVHQGFKNDDRQEKENHETDIQNDERDMKDKKEINIQHKEETANENLPDEDIVETEEENSEDYSEENSFPKIHTVDIPTKPIYPGEGVWSLPGIKHHPYIRKPEKITETKEDQDEHLLFFPEGKSFFESQSKSFNRQSEQFPEDFDAFKKQHNLVKPKLEIQSTQKPNFFDEFHVEDEFRNGNLEEEVNKYRYKPVISHNDHDVKKSNSENEESKAQILSQKQKTKIESEIIPPRNKYLKNNKEKSTTELHQISDAEKDDDEEDLFVPTKLYTQVRKYESEKHVPQSILEPRLREVVKDSKIHTVYSEEGYEDSGYDHAGHEKNAENSEGYSEVNPPQIKDPADFHRDVVSEGTSHEDIIHKKRQVEEKVGNPVKFDGDYTRTAIYKTMEMKRNQTDPIEHAVTTNMKIILSPNSKPKVSYDSNGNHAIGDLIMTDVQKHFQEGVKRKKRSVYDQSHQNGKRENRDQIHPIAENSSHATGNGQQRVDINTAGNDANNSNLKQYIEEFKNNDKSLTNSNKPEENVKSNIQKRFTNDFPKLDFDTSFIKLTKFEEAEQQKKERYPYYKSSAKMLNKNSALRYAQDMKTIPLKIEGEMSFYKNADKADCERVPDSVNPIPKRIEEASDEGIEEGDDKEVKGPRLEKLGDKIDCFKVKYFGENPLDSPFFGEGEVEQPEPIFGELKKDERNKQSVVEFDVEKLSNSDNKGHIMIQKRKKVDSDNSESQMITQESDYKNMPAKLLNEKTREIDYHNAFSKNPSIPLISKQENTSSFFEEKYNETIDSAEAKKHNYSLGKDVQILNGDNSKEVDSYLQAALKEKEESDKIKLPNLSSVEITPEDINGQAALLSSNYEYENFDEELENAETSSRLGRKLNFTLSPENANTTDLDYDYEYVDEPIEKIAEISSGLKEADSNSTEIPKSEALKIRIIKYRKRPHKIAYVASRRNNRYVANPNINLRLNLDPPPPPEGNNEFLRKKIKRKRVKPLSEVFYKDEIKPDEQLNVLTDVINNIKNSTIMEMESRKPVKFPTEVYRGNEINDIRTSFYQTSTVRPLRRKPQKPMVFEPSESESMSNFRYKKGPAFKMNSHVVKMMTKNHNAGKVMVHVNQNQHQAIPVRLKVNHPIQLQDVDQIPNQSVNTVNTLNTYFVHGMKPPLPEKPYLYSDFKFKGINTRRMINMDKRSKRSLKSFKEKNSKRSSEISVRIKRSPQRPGYSVISRQGMGSEADYKQEEEEEEDDYVPHRPMNFHYDPETKRIVYHNKPSTTTSAPEYIEVEYEDIEIATHPPKKVTSPKTVFHKDVLNPENGPTLVDFLAKLRSDPLYQSIPDPEPVKEKVTTTTGRPVLPGATTPPEFLKYLEMLHKSDGYKKIEDETEKPKTVSTTTTEIIIEDEVEDETPLENVQNSPGGQFSGAKPLQLFDISEYLPKTKSYNTRTSIDYSKYKTIQRTSVKPNNDREDEDANVSIRRRKIEGIGADEDELTNKRDHEYLGNKSLNTDTKQIASDKGENLTTRRRIKDGAEEADLGNNRRNYSEEQESKSSELSKKTVDSTLNLNEKTDKYTTIKRNRIRPIQIDDDDEDEAVISSTTSTTTSTEKIQTTTTRPRIRKRKRPTTLRPKATTEENSISSESTEEQVHTPATHKPASRVYPRRQRPKLRIRATTPSIENEEEEETVRKTRRTLRRQNETSTKIPPNHKEIYTEITPDNHIMMTSDPEIIETQKQPRLVTPDIIRYNKTEIDEPGKINPRNSKKIDVEVFKEFDTTKRHGGNYIRENQKRRRLRTTSTTTTVEPEKVSNEDNDEKDEVKILFDTDVKEDEEADDKASRSKKKIVIIKDPSKRLYIYAPLK